MTIVPDGAAMVPLLVGTVFSGAAIALSNVVLPSIVKQDFVNHLGLMSGLYTTAICGSAALGAGLTFPVYEAVGDWRLALGIWAVPVLVTAGLLAGLDAGCSVVRVRSPEDVPGVANEVIEQLVLHRGQGNRFAVAANLLAGEVDLQVGPVE